MIDDDRTRQLLIAALRANPSCIAVPSGRQVAIVRDGREWQVLVTVSREPEGFIYGHLFADRARRSWRALLVFSSAAVMTAFERASLAAYKRIVVEGMQYEPLYGWKPGDVSRLAVTRRAGIRAMMDLIAGYSPRLLTCPAGLQPQPRINDAVFEAYGLPVPLR